MVTFDKENWASCHYEAKTKGKFPESCYNEVNSTSIFLVCLLLHFVCSLHSTANVCSPSPCLNGGMCQPFGTSYVCFCDMGYTGMNCQIPRKFSVAFFFNYTSVISLFYSFLSIPLVPHQNWPYPTILTLPNSVQSFLSHSTATPPPPHLHLNPHHLILCWTVLTILHLNC